MVLGSGGREHALIRALKESRTVTEIHVAPGNDGMKADATVTGIRLDQLKELGDLYRNQKYELVVVGPDQALADGISDFFRDMGADVFGPSQEASRLEWSKSYAKTFMEEAKIPTARFVEVFSVEDVETAMEDFSPPWVLKADGLALGKGVYICTSPEELGKAAEEIFVEKKFGDAGKVAIIEEFKPGYEISLHVMTDGTNFQIFPYAQDHKRLLEGNKGPNTGGMGTIAPVEVDDVLRSKIENLVVKPAIDEIRKRKLLYRGVLFIGLMISEDEPYVLEFNSRFGDPETQVFMPLLAGDWGKVLLSVAQGECPRMQWNHLAAVCVVMAAKGYPEAPQKGLTIYGNLDGSETAYFLHAGTRFVDGGYVTNGGRVLNAVGVGPTLPEARARAYALASTLEGNSLFYRKDIGGAPIITD